MPLTPEANKLTILAGMPGCGKSCWAEREARERGLVVVSSDEVREYLGAGRDHHEDVKRTFMREVGEMVVAGLPVIADATNLSPSWREELRGLVGWRGVVRLVLFVNERQAMEVNADRGEEAVPLDAMYAMQRRLYRAVLDLAQGEWHHYRELLVITEREL
jgi:predicted kinase